MKKEYISPALDTEQMELLPIFCGSITRVEGETDITITNETDPGNVSGDARRLDIWDDEE